MEVAHDSKMSGYFGIKRTQERINACFHWPGMITDIRRYCKSYGICQRTVSKGRESHVPLGKMPLIDVPFSRVAIDLIGPLTQMSSEGHKCILTMVDYASRYPEAIPLKGCTAKEIAVALIPVFSHIGIPEEILTDQVRHFTANYMQEFMDIMDIKHLLTSPYHTICNGLVESFNGTLKQMLYKLCKEQPCEWNKLINPLLFAY